MRVYIIGNDGITLCRAPPAAVKEGEIVVASNEELLAAELSGKRLRALWNALSDVERRRKVWDRGALIDQLWSAIEALPDPELHLRAVAYRRSWRPAPAAAAPARPSCTAAQANRSSQYTSSRRAEGRNPAGSGMAGPNL
jgi:hypothetical protein